MFLKNGECHEYSQLHMNVKVVRSPMHIKDAWLFPIDMDNTHLSLYITVNYDIRRCI